MEEDKSTTDSMLIGFNRMLGEDIATLLVGKKRENGSVEIINAFEGEEAIELYEKLITIKNKEEI